MKKKTSNLTLSNIKKIISENNIDLVKMMDEKLARNNVLIFGAIDASAERLETDIKDFRKEMNQRFDANDDTHQEILAAVDEMTDAKLAKFEKKYLAA